MANIGTISVKLLADAGRFIGGMKKSKQSVSGLNKGMSRLATSVKLFGIASAGAAVFGLARLGSQVTKTIDDIAKTSRRLGVGTQELDGFRFAAKLGGMEVRAFDVALQRLVKRIGEIALTGKGESKPILDFLGLDAVELAKLGPAESLLRVADALSKVENSLVKVKLAEKLFDSEGVNMINVLDGGRKRLLELRQESRDMGNVFTNTLTKSTEEANDSVTRLGQAWQGFGVKMAPVINIIKRGVTDSLIGRMRKFGRIADGFNAIAGTNRRRLRGARSRNFVSPPRIDESDPLAGLLSSGISGKGGSTQFEPAFSAIGSASVRRAIPIKGDPEQTDLLRDIADSVRGSGRAN